MNVSINNFILFFDSIIKNASKKYKFVGHINNREKLREVYYPNNKKQKNIRNTIEAQDFLYFMCRKSLNNSSYEKINGSVRDEELCEVTPDAYKKQSQRKPFEFFEYIYGELYNYCNDNCLYSTNKNNLLTCSTNTDNHLAPIDGSHYTLSRNLIKDGLPSYNNGNTTSLTILTILNQENRLPIYVNYSKNNDEINAFVEKLSIINKYYIFVCDRLFYSEKLLRQIKAEGHDVIFRLQYRETYVKKFIDSKKTDTIITINGKKVKRGDPQGIRIRLVKYYINNNMYVLGTTLLNKTKYPITFLMDAYKYRWDIEQHYKLVNYDLQLKDSNVKTLNAFLQELYAKLIIICLAKIFSSIAIKYCAVPLQKYEYINFKSCMETVTVHILREICYGSREQSVYHKIQRLTENIRFSTIKCEPDRSYIRRAIRTNKKWYYLFYSRQASEKLEKAKGENKSKKKNKKGAHLNKLKKKKVSKKVDKRNEREKTMEKEKEVNKLIPEVKRKVMKKKINDGIG